LILIQGKNQKITQRNRTFNLENRKHRFLCAIFWFFP
jgi:hypothetical protein